MYKVMGFKEAVATRKVFLLNEETGTQETCFDDSGLAGEENFLFMKQGERYECKIKLFGRLGLPERQRPAGLHGFRAPRAAWGTQTGEGAGGAGLFIIFRKEN